MVVFSSSSSFLPLFKEKGRSGGISSAHISAFCCCFVIVVVAASVAAVAVVFVVDVVFVLVVAAVPGVVTVLLFAFPPNAVVDGLSPTLAAPGVVVRHPAGKGILRSSVSLTTSFHAPGPSEALTDSSNVPLLMFFFGRGCDAMLYRGKLSTCAPRQHTTSTSTTTGILFSQHIKMLGISAKRFWVIVTWRTKSPVTMLALLIIAETSSACPYQIKRPPFCHW